MRSVKCKNCIFYYEDEVYKYGLELYGFKEIS